MADGLIRAAELPAIREWTESLWGKWSQYHQVREVPGAPVSIPRAMRLNLRMPNTAEKRILLERDGYHCRFCGIPVIREVVRQRMRQFYPDALPWGRSNASQHAAFQALWVQYDHLLPHARGGDNSVHNMVITCGPCNFGRGDYILEEMGLLDPRTREPVRSSWDGLERFQPLKRAPVVRQVEPASPSRRRATLGGKMDQEKFLSDTSPSTVSFFKEVLAQSERCGLAVGWTDAGFKIHVKGQSIFLYCYPAAMYNQGSSVIEVYLARLENAPIAEELRRRVLDVEHVIIAGSYSLRVFVTGESLASAREVFDIAVDVMTRPVG